MLLILQDKLLERIYQIEVEVARKLSFPQVQINFVMWKISYVILVVNKLLKAVRRPNEFITI